MLIWICCFLSIFQNSLKLQDLFRDSVLLSWNPSLPKLWEDSTFLVHVWKTLSRVSILRIWLICHVSVYDLERNWLFLIMEDSKQNNEPLFCPLQSFNNIYSASFLFLVPPWLRSLNLLWAGNLYLDYCKSQLAFWVSLLLPQSTC